jgi:hypothetical protein
MVVHWDPVVGEHRDIQAMTIRLEPGGLVGGVRAEGFIESVA